MRATSGSNALASEVLLTADNRRIIIAAIVTTSFVGMGLSLMIPLLSLELERMGASTTVNGLSTAVGGVANVLIAPLVPAFSAWFGQKRFLAANVLMLAASVLVFKLMPSIAAWFVIRFFFGAAIGTMFVLSEFWITASAPEARRGVIMGIYATVLAIGFAAGPAILALTGTQGWPPYLACAGLVLLAIAPVVIAPANVPPIDRTPTPRLFSLIAVAPVATLAALMFGALETGMFNQLPLYGVRVGLSETQAALLVTIAALGNLLLQIPLGALSDRMDRRLLLLACTSIGVVGALAIPMLQAGTLPFNALLFVWGGVIGAIYTVGLAHLGSRFPASEVAAANAVFIMLYSFGMIVGPPFVGAAMETFGTWGFPLSLAAMLGAYGALIVWRMAKSASHA